MRRKKSNTETRFYSRRIERNTNFIIMAASLLAMIGVSLLLQFSPSISRITWRLLSTNNRLDYLAVLTALGFVGLLLLFVLTVYYQLDYRRHKKPLALEDPGVRYGLLHHAKTVFIPRVLYKKKVILFRSTYTSVLLILLAAAVCVQLSRTFANPGGPAVARTLTNAKTTQQTTELRGEVTNGMTPNLDYIINRGFQYGTTTSYGETIPAGVLPPYVTGYAISQQDSGAQFFYPKTFARDSAGYVYVNNQSGGKSTVIKFNPDYTLNSQWNCIYLEEGECLDNFGRMVADTNGHIYLISNNKITRVNTDGTQLLDWSLGGGTATDIAVENTGNVLVLFQDKLVRYGPTGSLLDELSTYINSPSPYNQAQSVAVGSDQSIYIKYQAQRLIKKIATNGTESFIDIQIAQGSPAFDIDEQDNFILGDRLTIAWTADSNGTNTINSNSHVLDTLALPDGSILTTSSDYDRVQLSVPQYRDIEFRREISGLACATTYHYRAYIDSLDERVYGEDKSFTTAPCNFVNETVSTQSATAVGDTSATLNGTVSGNIAGAIGQTYFAYGLDTSYGSHVSSNSLSQVPVHVDTFGSSGSGNGQFDGAGPMAVASNGDIYVADVGGNRVQKFSPDGDFILNWGSSGSGNGQFNAISAIGVDKSDNVFVADSSDYIQQFDQEGNYLSKLGGSGSEPQQFNNIRAIHFASQGTYEQAYIADCGNNRVQSYLRMGNYFAVHASDSSYIKRQYMGAFGAAGTGEGQFNCPSGITGEVESLSILDSGNNRVQRFNASTFESSFGSAGTGNGQFVQATGLSTGADQAFYIGDAANQRMQRLYDGTVAGHRATWGSAGSGPSQFGQISDVVTDKNGNIYVADSTLNRIQKFSLSHNTGPFSMTVQNLTCGTTYHYQALARQHYAPLTENPYDNFGTYGEDKTFTTASCPPPTELAVETGSSSNVTTNSAKLFGEITNTGQGNITGVGFNYGETTSYGYSVNQNQGPYNAQQFSLDLTGLECGKTFHYQAWAYNGEGYSTGADHQFSTAACPVYDLSVSQRLLTELPITQGKQATFRIAITNLGPSVWSSDTNLIMTLPVGFTFQSISDPYQCVDTRTMMQDGEDYEDSYYGRHYPGHTTVICVGSTSQYEVAAQGVFEVDITGTATQNFVSGSSLNRVLVVDTSSVERPEIDFQSVFQADGDFWTVDTNNISRWTYNYTPGTTPPVEPPTPPIQPPKKPASTPTTTTTPPIIGEENPFSPQAIQKLQAGGITELPSKTASANTRRGSARLFSVFFLSLLLLLAVAYAAQAWREYRFVRGVRLALVAAKRRVATVQQFLEIVTHYLNTPLAVMQGAHELMTSKHALDGAFLASFGQKLAALKLSVQGFEGSVQIALAPAAQSSFSKADQALLTKARNLWAGQLAIGLGIAAVDLSLLLTGAYEKRGAQLTNNIILTLFSGLLIWLLYFYHSRAKVLHAGIDQDLVNTRGLVRQKEELLQSVAPTLEHHAGQLRQGTEGMDKLPDAHLLMNGLGMLQKLATKLTSYERLTQLEPVGSVDVGAYYKQSIDPAIQQQAQTKSTTVKTTVTDGLLVPLRSEQLDYILSAVVGNAVEYSPANSAVTVLIRTVGGKVGIRVADNGPGLTPEAQKTLFEPLQRGTDVTTFDHEGLGLSLFVSKAIVEQSGGSIKVTSTQKSGTAIDITLPVVKGEVQGQDSNIIKPMA